MSLNVAMWGKALSVIPRVSKDEWGDLDVVSKWLIATRSAVIVMTVMSSAIAGLLAARDGGFDTALWIAVTVGLVFAHATNNLLNDLTDYLKGVDKDNYFRAQYGPQPLEHGLMSQRELIHYAVATGAVALAAGFYLVWMRGEVTLSLLGIGVVFVLFYTWPLKYIGLGEVAVLVVWGPLMVGGGYYVVTGSIEREVILASLPFSLAATTVLFGKHIDKLDADGEKKIRTLPVLLGSRLSRYCTIAMLVGQYALVIYLVTTGYFSPVLLVVVLAVPAMWLAVRVYMYPRPSRAPKRLPAGIWPLWFVAFAFRHTRQFGALYLLGLVLDVVGRRFGLL